MTYAETIEAEGKLEEILDASSLSYVLEALALICYGKSAHLSENWQDNSASHVWTMAAKYLEKASGTIAVRAVS